jgi:hypothetical protein
MMLGLCQCYHPPLLPPTFKGAMMLMPPPLSMPGQSSSRRGSAVEVVTKRREHSQVLEAIRAREFDRRVRCSVVHLTRSHRDCQGWDVYSTRS